MLEVFQKQGYEEFVGIFGDVFKFEDCVCLVAEMFNYFGQFDVVVNNVGILVEGDVSEFLFDVFCKVIEVNYLGSVYMIQQFLFYFCESWGMVFFVLSIVVFWGILGYVVYSVFKVVFKILFEVFRVEEEQYGVYVGIVFVGFIENDF